MRKAPRRRPSLECLEVRHLPATFGLPWPDPQHLTLSFMPDGTRVGGAPSTLAQTLGARMAAPAWQLDVLRAFQSWAVLADINISLVGDNGQAPGRPGPLQGDPGFGDIRLGARPLSTGTLALATPFDLGNNWSGDVLLNSRAVFGAGPKAPEDLLNAVLHEAGHVLGLPDNPSDPTSVMSTRDTGTHTAPSPADAAALRALYGSRPADARDDATFATATPLAFASGGSGPDAFSVAAAGLSGLGDQDVYRVDAPSGGAFAVALRTSGVSLLTALVTVYDASGRPVTSATAPDPLHGDLTLTVPAAAAGARFFVKVEAARPDVFGVGAYRLAAGAPGRAPAPPGAAPAAADPPTDLTPQTTGTDARWPYLVHDRLSGLDRTEGYRIQAGPVPTAAMVLTVWGDQPGGLSPRVTVFDARHNPVPARVLAIDAASESVQILAPTPGARYVVEVTAADPGGASPRSSGAYTLAITDRGPAVAPDTLASGTLAGVRKETFLGLTVTTAEVYHLDLSGSTADSRLWLTVFDAANRPVETLSVLGGAGPVAGDVVLPAGHYTVRILGANRNPGRLSAIHYTLHGTHRSDPIGPSPIDTTLDPVGLPGPSVPEPRAVDILIPLLTTPPGPTVLIDPFTVLWWF